jgi:hypothetical protein
VSFLVVAQSSSEVPEGLMNNPVLNYRNISLADYLSVVLFMFILLTSVKLPNKKMAGAVRS